MLKDYVSVRIVFVTAVAGPQEPVRVVFAVVFVVEGVVKSVAKLPVRPHALGRLLCGHVSESVCVKREALGVL